MNSHRARARLLPQWTASANGTPVSAIVVGGGHLLTGSTDYFPVRLNVVAELARVLDAPIHVHSVGVSNPDTWETGAGQELRRFMQDAAIASISVRDPESAEYLSTAGLSNADVRIAMDPGLLTAGTFNVSKRGPHSRPRIGLGVMCPATVKAIRKTPSQIDTAFYIATAEAIAAGGADVCLFTTGEVDDIEAAHDVSSLLGERGIAHFQDAIAPRDDTELVADIAGFDAIVAQRLHASIVSYALAVPSVGVGWDAKVRSFYRLTERLDCFVDDRAAEPADVAGRALNAAARGLDPAACNRHIEACRDGVRSLATLIRELH